MDDLQKEKLRRFADDEVMFNAVVNVIIESLPPFVYRPDMPNAQIGELIRAQQIAGEYIRKGFAHIRTTHKSKIMPAGDKLNPAV